MKKILMKNSVSCFLLLHFFLMMEQTIFGFWSINKKVPEQYLAISIVLNIIPFELWFVCIWWRDFGLIDILFERMILSWFVDWRSKNLEIILQDFWQFYMVVLSKIFEDSVKERKELVDSRLSNIDVEII